MTTYKLPSMEHSFSITMNGSETKTTFTGDFTYRRPTISQRTMIEQMRCKLNGDLKTIDPDIAAINDAVSWLRFTLIKFPDWWSAADYGGQMYDTNVIEAIYNKVIEFEAQWRKDVNGGNPKDVADGVQTP